MPADPAGWSWGPFTARLPFLHLRPEAPELIQGLLVAATTGLAVTPIYLEYFGMPFDTAVALVVVQSLLIYSAFLLFGEPFCPGWLTPALPLVLAKAASYETAAERIDFVNALVLTVAAVFIVFGLTGLGRRFILAIPGVVRAGIVLGAGISALYGETLARSGGRLPRLEAYPISIALATGVTLLLLYSRPLAALRERSRAAAFLSSLGVAPGFLLAMVVGPWVGEIDYSGLASYAGGLVYLPNFSGLAEFNVWGRGLPPAAMFAASAPLAAVAYVVAVGDLVTGEGLVLDAAGDRPDESIRFDRRRSHLTLGARNAAVGLLGGPFFPLQGPLWAGATVIVTERYRRGPRAMQSLYSGIASYYLLGLPILYFCGPALALFRPALDVAFSLTLLLTGFACGGLAMSMVEDRLERGLALSIGAAIAFSSLTVGVALGFALTAALLGPSAWRNEPTTTTAP